MNCHKQKAWHLINRNELHEAKSILRKSCRSAGKADAENWFMLGIIDGRLGQFGDAEKHFRKAVKLQPALAEAYDGLGAALHQQGKSADAITMFKQSVELKPDNFTAHFNLGNALRNSGDLTGAANHYNRVLEYRPGHHEALNNLAITYLDQGLFDSAVTCFRKATRVQPDWALPWFGLGKALREQGLLTESEQTLLHGIKLDATNVQSHMELGMTNTAQGWYDRATAAFQTAVKLEPESIDAYSQLGHSLIRQGHLNKAKVIFQGMLDEWPDSSAAIIGLAAVANMHGDHNEVLSLLTPLIENKKITPLGLVLYSAACKNTHRHREIIQIMETMLEKKHLDHAARRQLLNELGNLHNDLGKHNQAFKHFREANELQPYRFDPDALRAAFDEVIEVFSKDFMAHTAHASLQTRRPVFIVGMLRSGTSLVEQILCSHHSIAGAGELTDLFDISDSIRAHTGTAQPYPLCLPDLDTDDLNRLARIYINHLSEISSTAARVTDKMPHNFIHLGLIELLFPEAHIIHCVRDPRDTCLSNYFIDFQGRHAYTNNLVHLGEYYAEYQRLMKHWHAVLSTPILEVSYEELTVNQEQVSRRMVDFCGLEWDEKCLDFHNNKRLVQTMSYQQVNQPMYSSSVGRWKHYREHIAPLIEILSRHGCI